MLPDSLNVVPPMDVTSGITPGSVRRQTILRNGGAVVFAIGRAAIAGGGDPGHALRVALLREFW